MCLWFDSCFGPSVHQDYGHDAADGKQGQGFHGNGHRAPYQTAADEAGRKAHNDARKDHAVVAGAAAARDGHGDTAYAQDKTLPYSAADETLLRGKTRSVMTQSQATKARFYEPADKEDTTGYHYPTTPATIARVTDKRVFATSMADQFINPSPSLGTAFACV